jgi:hypothetical protein
VTPSGCYVWAVTASRFVVVAHTLPRTPHRSRDRHRTRRARRRPGGHGAAPGPGAIPARPRDARNLTRRGVLHRRQGRVPPPARLRDAQLLTLCS